MQYIGLQTQIWRNNFHSLLLLIMFPSLIIGLTGVFFFLADNGASTGKVDRVLHASMEFLPIILTGVGIWFVIAYFFHSKMISLAVDSKPLERKEGLRVYNLVENLCISVGMRMPKIYIIEDDSLNAFASGVDSTNFAVTLSRGIINKLSDDELAGVIAHELTHIRNRDVRLLIVSIIFVGIFGFIAETAVRMVFWGGHGKSDEDKKNFQLIILVLILASIGYLLSILFKFSLSRKREYLADAGAAQITRNPLALASALKKVSQDPYIEAVTRRDVAQLFIESPQSKTVSFFTGLFATHPPIKDRIAILEAM